MINKGLKTAIERMRDKDQGMRRAIMTANTKANQRAMESLDRNSTEACRKIVAEYGWPNFGLVGKKAAHSFWLLVQHAVHDRRFQKSCLALMREAVSRNQAYAKDMAYLEDRLLLAEGKKQKYGTQFLFKDGKVKLQPVADRKNLNGRRAEVGMGTIEEYTERAEKAFRKMTAEK